MATFKYIEVNTLQEDVLIAGSEQNYYFDVVNETGSPIDLSSATTSVVFFPYGQPDYPILTKTGSWSGSSIPNRFFITLLSSDTAGSQGKFGFHPRVVDYNGSVFKPAQGILTIVASPV